MNFINKSAAHSPDLFSSKRGAVKGIAVGNNHNILRGGRQTRRRKRRRKYSGGGYGFSPNPLPNYGKKHMNWIKTPNACGQKGGGGLDSRYLGGQGKGRIYHSFTSAAGAVPGTLAPMTRMVESQCGGRKKRRRRRSKRRRSRSRRQGRRSRRRRNGRRRRSRRRKKRRQRYQRGCRRTQRGGGRKAYSPSYKILTQGDWKTANPPSFTTVNRCGPENYNHYTGQGSP